MILSVTSGTCLHLNCFCSSCSGIDKRRRTSSSNEYVRRITRVPGAVLDHRTLLLPRPAFAFSVPHYSRRARVSAAGGLNERVPAAEPADGRLSSRRDDRGCPPAGAAAQPAFPPRTSAAHVAQRTHTA